MLERLRNIGIIAHVDAGKTTTTERILYFAGCKHKAGDVDEGNTTTDYDPLEKAKGITINSAAVTVDWDNVRITLIDTPGHVDFTAEVERSLRVLDGAVGIFCAVGGVEVQSETVWHQADKHRVPRIAFINKLDRTGADFWGCIEQMKSKLGIVPAVCTIPAGQDSAFEGVIDLIRMQFWYQDRDDPTHLRYEWRTIPESYRAEAERAREQLLETATHACDELLEAVLEGNEVSEEMLRRALRAGTLAGKLTPVHCGSAKEYHGVRLLLDAIRDYLPSPKDRPPVEGFVPKTREPAQRRPERDEPFCALAFKTIGEKHGDLVFLRIYAGVLRPGDTVFNSTIKKAERVSHIYRLMGDRRERLEEAGPGEIVAVVGLKQTATGHTLCATDQPIVLEEIRFPEPVISQAIIPGKNVDESKLADALGKMVRDDPTLRCRTDPETNQLILSGMGELHLEVAVHKLERDHGVPVSVGKPMVAYRQTLARPVELETRYIKQTGGRGKYAVIYMRFEPLTKEQAAELAAEMEERGERPDPNNLFFKDEIFGGAVPTEYIPAVEEGFRQACQKGAKYGFPCVDILATLLDGKYHEVDSSADTFRLAAIECFRDAQLKAGLVLLEPIMNVVVYAPGQYLGDLIRDVSRRRGEILNSRLDKGRCQLHAYVPLAELFGYTSELRNFTSGTASFSMEPSHYAPVKEELADLRQAS
ncbi:MAG TPA: elongation factor G [Gemmataceae bacterium]|nr:elongation factor G [Gemmataceae bacterium]